MMSSATANLAWDASMGGSSGFAGLFVFLFDSQWLLFCYIPSIMAPYVGACPSQHIHVICVVQEEWGAFVATTKAFNPPSLARMFALYHACQVRLGPWASP